MHGARCVAVDAHARCTLHATRSAIHVVAMLCVACRGLRNLEVADCRLRAFGVGARPGGAARFHLEEHEGIVDDKVREGHSADPTELFIDSHRDVDAAPRSGFFYEEV